jgi:hypothetical protein
MEEWFPIVVIALLETVIIIAIFALFWGTYYWVFHYELDNIFVFLCLAIVTVAVVVKRALRRRQRR